MAEYIEKEKTARILQEEAAAHYPTAFHVGLYAAARAIDSIPAADVRPVVRGKWEEDCAGAAVCSVCGEYAFETSTHHLCGWFPNYCPNCGATMEES